MQNYYAPPAGGPGGMAPGGYHAPQAGGAWRDGEHLVVIKGSALPDRCVKCNAPAQGFTLSRMLYWNPPWVYVTILLGLLIFVIVALVTRKQGMVSFGLCPEHRSQRTKLHLAAGITPLLTIGGCAASVSADAPMAAVVCVFLTLILPFVFIVLATPMSVKLIDDRALRLKVGPEFLASFDAQPGE
ncbi:MAG: hypothetical protein AB7K71_22475 [Polyangiaceae bacterium]